MRPREQFEALQAARARTETKEYARRAGIEGTISCGIRTGKMRRSRYVGMGKVHLGNLSTATALNFRRVDEWLLGIPIATTRKSLLARLMVMPAPA